MLFWKFFFISQEIKARQAGAKLSCSRVREHGPPESPRLTHSQQHQAQQLFHPGSKPTQQKPGSGGLARPHNTKEKESPNLAEAGLVLGTVSPSTTPIRGKKKENAPPRKHEADVCALGAPGPCFTQL